MNKEKLNQVLNVEGQGTQDKAQSDNLPVKVHKNFYQLQFLLFLILLTMIFAVYPISRDGVNEGYIDLYDYEGLKFQNIKIDRIRNEEKLNFVISGKIVNRSSKRFKIPKIKVQVLSEGGNVMNELELQPEEEYIFPQNEVEFNPTLRNVSGNADRIVFKLGSWLENYL